MSEIRRAPAHSPELAADLLIFAETIESGIAKEAERYRGAPPALDAAVSMQAAWHTLMSTEKGDTMPALRGRVVAYLGANGVNGEAQRDLKASVVMLELLAPTILGELYGHLPKDRPKPDAIVAAENDRHRFLSKLALVAGGARILHGVRSVLGPEPQPSVVV